MGKQFVAVKQQIVRHTLNITYPQQIHRRLPKADFRRDVCVDPDYGRLGARVRHEHGWARMVLLTPVVPTPIILTERLHHLGFPAKTLCITCPNAILMPDKCCEQV